MAEKIHPLAKRKEELAEHILVSHIICVLVVFLAIMALNVSFKLGQVYLTALYYYTGVVLFLLVVVIPYLSKKFSSQPWTGEALLLVILFPLILALIYLTKGFDGSKVLLFVPVVIAASSYGKTIGVLSALIASTAIFVLDLRQFFIHTVSPAFQIDLIYTGILFTIAWLIGGLTDIERRTQVQLLSLANTDTLTGFTNHRHFYEKLTEELEIARGRSKPVSLIMIDINYFKFFNDIYGYQKGDLVIVEIGRILEGLISPPSFVARYGGDEFAVVMPGINRLEALQKAGEIEEKIKKYSIEGDHTQPGGKITVSLGLACFPEDGEKPRDLVKSADDACYQSKHSRSRICFSVIDQLYSLSQSEKDLFDCFKALLTIINVKDRYTFAHSERVMSYAVAVAERIDLPEEQKTELKYGAYLHDIGKVDIEADILNKNGPLMFEEWEITKQHPVWGSDIVRPLLSLEGLVSLVRHHHENYDGTGYPDGLIGQNIPLSARIMRIADSFDAMTTDRPYRKGMTHEEAFEELRKYSGKMYDPALVEAFINTII
ncbi:MAG TPA: diguanylate cyclase [Desulfotomaculum sp.]|nr:MAG: Diguanylate cyclase and metal dependent phosphohydrolase [Desulfotomaculum sp. 46_80]KUK85229.1 MAG: Diguanylate cyclase and metal dependent phosphohydrolase [Desulfofundulus kuznetsovii]HAG11158.1 diguanylate cyclase [Desulfotomaculum sp.]HBY03267.1 diguanylate cyclase [Desulfotomaculum sp.]